MSVNSFGCVYLYSPIIREKVSSSLTSSARFSRPCLDCFRATAAGSRGGEFDRAGPKNSSSSEQKIRGGESMVIGTGLSSGEEEITMMDLSRRFLAGGGVHWAERIVCVEGGKCRERDMLAYRICTRRS